MIRLEKARFHNFRALRDAEVEFSTDEKRRLTVIRAENGTGKTSMLYGLTWCLFGDEALPGRTTRAGRHSRKTNGYRVHPIDWDVETEGATAYFRVELDLTLVDDRGETTSYHVVRRGYDTVEGTGFTPGPTTLTVDKSTAVGSHTLDDPTAFLEKEVLPASLKQIFFTDSDVALDYVEAATTDERRRNVGDAVRNLLGLDVLEKAREHVGKSRGEIQRRITAASSGSKYGDLKQSQINTEGEIASREKQLAELQEQSKIASTAAAEAEKARDQILLQGGEDREKLARELQRADHDFKRALADYDEVGTESRKLLNTPQLLNSLIQAYLVKNMALFDQMKKDHRIPNVLPEIVEERLAAGTCICGADLSEGSPGHAHLIQELAQQEEFEGSHQTLTILAGTAQQALAGYASGPLNWFAVASNTLGQIERTRQAVESTQKRHRDIDYRLSQVKDSDLQLVREQLGEANASIKAIQRQLGAASHQLDDAKRNLVSILEKVHQQETSDRRLQLRRCEETAADDLLRIINGTIEVLQDDTIGEVGRKMNEIFQRMIVQSPEGEADNAVIQQVVLTPDFDIKAFGPGGRELDTANALNGAARRALTVSFILALVQVSEKAAPIVIDTPLGMTSGALRRAFLQYAVDNSKQLVLFLTRSEIAGIEELLDEHAGKQQTLSITSHYPQQLENDPGTRRVEVMVCFCGHRQECSVCARRKDI